VLVGFVELAEVLLVDSVELPPGGAGVVLEDELPTNVDESVVVEELTV